ncbi:hypothetical protein NEDG_00909 [Nematocida displodere]|uniref:Uncharacterized protein n=1 Tax=Nematocida displodere TaxID=1805483 RepID=A0A177EDH3_9MICR|nr:hypothetical protein NEDG_00909 [Nematocida displodere]
MLLDSQRYLEIPFGVCKKLAETSWSSARIDLPIWHRICFVVESTIGVMERLTLNAKVLEELKTSLGYFNNVGDVKLLEIKDTTKEGHLLAIEFYDCAVAWLKNNAVVVEEIIIAAKDKSICQETKEHLSNSNPINIT